MIGAAGLTAVGSRKGLAATRHFEGYPGSLAVLHDITLCIGCRSCEAGCNKVNQLPPPEVPFTDLSVLEKKRRTTAKSYTVVNKAAFSKRGKKGHLFQDPVQSLLGAGLCLRLFREGLHQDEAGFGDL